MIISKRVIRGWAAAAALMVPVTVCSAETKSAVVLPDTFGTVVIGDIVGLMDKVGALASKVMPGITADMLKQQAGGMLGDPSLAGLPAGSGLAVVVPKAGLPYGFLEVSEAKAADYQKLLKSRNLGQVDQAEGLIIVGADAAGIDAAKAAAGQVKSTVLAGSGSPTISGSVKLADVLKQYDAQIQGAIASMSQKVEEADKATTGSSNVDASSAMSVFRGYYAVAKRIDTMELNFEPSGEGLLLSQSFTPVGGGAAAAPAAGNSADMLKLLPGGGAMRGHASFDMAGLAAIINDIMKEAAGDGTSKVDTAALDAWLKECAAAFGGTAAFNFMSDPTAAFAGSYAMSLKDEAGALKIFKEMPEKMEAVGFMKFYEAMGMPMKMTFKEKVREHAGVPIHQLTMNMDFTRGSEEQQKRMKELMGNIVYDVAIANKTLVYSVAPEKVETIIDAVKSGSNAAAKPLISNEKLPAGGRGYFDYNVGAAMQVASQMSSTEKGPGADAIKQMAEAVKSAAPLQLGWYNEGGKYRLITQIPADTISSFVQAGQKVSASNASAAKSASTTEEGAGADTKARRSSGPRTTKKAPTEKAPSE